MLAPPAGERNHAQGPDAAMTLVEYGDYHETRCADVQPWIKALQAQLGERRRLVFRHFPADGLRPHAAEAAGLQGRFWPMHETLREHQSALGSGYLVEYAYSLGLDTHQFLRDMACSAAPARAALSRQLGLQHRRHLRSRRPVAWQRPD